MIQLDISPDDLQTLCEVLESSLSDLRYEINDTDSYDYRETLRKRQQAMERILEQLKQA
jgi:hypothetical protein